MGEGDDTPNIQPENLRRTAVARIGGAIFVAAAFGLGIYYLLTTLRPDAGLISFSFLLGVPAAVCAFLSYVIDPLGKRGLGSYLLVPIWTLIGVVLLSLIFLREGIVCIIMLMPLWVISGLLGAWLTYLIRKRLRNKGRTYSLTVLLLPLMVIVAEPHLNLPEATATVTRSIIVEAPPERIWPLLRGIPDVRADEGQWNLSQDVIGIPRPKGARLEGEGLGADRHADWGGGIRFREQIIEWQSQKAIGWRFIFDDLNGWAFTDRHLMPDSAYFKVTTGGYHLETLGHNRTRVTLHTRYWMKTPVNGYCALWGEAFLGDLETNLLALVRQRAETADRTEPDGV